MAVLDTDLLMIERAGILHKATVAEFSSVVLTWIDYVSGKTDGVETAVTDGVHYTYTFGGVTVYRFVSTALDVNGYPVSDAFYSDLALTVLLAERGV